MNRVIKQLRKSFDVAKKKGWEKIYILVDIHDTILVPTYSVELSNIYYTYAKEALQIMSERKNICLILWSSSLPEFNIKYKDFFKNDDIIFTYINCNPECEESDFADFKTKPYMNLILDDKAGFIPDEDWEALYNYFINENAEEISID